MAQPFSRYSQSNGQNLGSKIRIFGFPAAGVTVPKRIFSQNVLILMSQQGVVNVTDVNIGK